MVKNKFNFISALLAIFILFSMPISLAQESKDTDIKLENYPDILLNGKDIDLFVGESAKPADTLGAVDISTNLQFMAKEEVELSSSLTNQVVKGVQKDLELGQSLTNNQTGFKTELKEFDGIDLFDGQIYYNGKNYDAHEEITDISGRVLYSGKDNDGFDKNIAVQLNSLSVCYVFDENLELDNDQNVEIQFLGKKLEIVDFNYNEVKIVSGTEYFMDVGDTVTINNKKITLLNVGSAGSIVVEVDGTVDTVSDYTKTVNGLQIVVGEIFYSIIKSERASSLNIGEIAERIYEDSDPATNYGYENNKEDAEWVYDLKTTDDEIVAGDKICLSYNKNHKDVTDDDNEKALYEGDSIELPNNKGILLFKSVSEPKMVGFTFEKYTNDNVNSSLNVLFELSSTRDEAFNNQYNKVYINDTFGFIDEDGLDLGTSVSMSDNSDVTFEITSTDFIVNNINDNQINLSHNVGKIFSIHYGSEDLSDSEETIRTKYGSLIENPENTIDDDDNKLNIDIPTEQVKVVLVIGTVDVRVGDTETFFIPKELDITTKLDNEGFNLDNNYIVVGGSCANTVFEEISGISCEGWAEEVGDGNAIVMIKEYEGNVALLVAGTTAKNTRAVSRLLSDWEDNKDKFVGSKIILSV